MSRTASRTVSLAQTKSSLAECVRAAERGEEVVITRHGKPVAGLVPATDLALLRRLRAAQEGRGLAGLAGGWPGSAEVARLAVSRRRTSRVKRAAS
jgi:prevent-host-death family protein